MSTLPQVIGRNIKRLRIAKGWSQSDLAQKTGFDEAYIGVLERGQANPSLTTVSVMAGTLNVDACQLIQDADNNVD